MAPVRHVRIAGLGEPVIVRLLPEIRLVGDEADIAVDPRGGGEVLAGVEAPVAAEAHGLALERGPV